MARSHLSRSTVHSSTARRKRSPLAPRLAAYSATAGAALACAATSDAAISNITGFTILGGNVTTNPPSQTLPGPGNAPYQSVLAGKFNFIIAGTYFNTANRQEGHFFLTQQPGSGAQAGFATTGFSIRKMNAADPLAGQVFGGIGNMALKNNSIGTHLAFGQFLPAANHTVTGYIGLKEAKSATTFYGWLRVQVKADGAGFPLEMNLIALDGQPGVYGAYDTKADIAGGDGFAVGSTATVPEPSTAALGGLGLLALGAAGLRELRRRRAAVLES